ncbi:ATP-binding cassette domain-containing protein, partial [Candidatus Poribacteria bacterium]|nr:ATP-binding cassette domain-containing protein [Candidatus Poribacteria bacterium]
VRINPELRIGYVAQEARFDESKSLREEICDNEILAMKAQIEKLEIEMETLKGDKNRLAEVMNRYDVLQSRFQSRDGYRYEYRLETILHRMGFKSSDMELPASALSGGQKSRAQLARALLKQPDLLLLDEPGNHLDVDAMEWLGNFLRNYRGTLLMVSHDRYLLDEVTEKTIELEFGKLRQYNGNYSYYADQKERERIKQHYDYVNQQQEIAHLEEAIATLRSWSVKGKSSKFSGQVRSMKKTLDRMDLIDKPRKKTKMQLNLEFQKRSGEMVVEFVNLSKSYGDNVLFSKVDLNIRWGENVAIVGPNGSGKTTLLRIILGLEEPTGGEVNLGENLLISYFDQEQRGLKPDNTIYSELGGNTDLSNEETMYLLSKLMFRGDKAFKKIDNLSGGEKNRVVLSKLVYTKANLLVLDEPTNHLDIPSIEVLEEALETYKGTVIMVSHDRHLLSRIAQRVIEIKHGQLHSYAGGYEHYLRMRDQLN